MILLKATNEILEVTTTSTSAIDVSASFVDVTTTTFVPSTQETKITTATTTTVVAAPAASTQRQIKYLKVFNAGTALNTITIKKDISGTEYVVYKVGLLPGESLEYVDGNGFNKLAPSGEIFIRNPSSTVTPISTRAPSFVKVGVTMEAAGVQHSTYNHVGNPGPFVVGTPGLAGRNLDGTLSTERGCIDIKYPISGANFLTSFSCYSSVNAFVSLNDYLWINSGIVVTTTTAQTIGSPTLTALGNRDLNGNGAGNGVQVGLLVTAATTNAGAVTTITMSYTNENGTSGRTATMTSFPITAVLGTFVPFNLQQGDQGVQTIQSITLGTSLVTGSVSLVALVYLAGIPIAASTGSVMQNLQGVNVRLYPGVCIIPHIIPFAATATNINGFLSIEEK